MDARIYVSKKSVQQTCFFPKSGGKSLLFFLLMLDAQERPFLTTPLFQSYIHRLRLTSSAQTEKNCHVRGQCYAIPPGQTSPILPLPINILHYCPHAQHACCTLYNSTVTVLVLGSKHCAVVTVHCSRWVVMRRWPALCICIIHSALVSVARTCTLLRYSDSIHVHCTW